MNEFWLTVSIFGALGFLIILGVPFAFASGGVALGFALFLFGPDSLLLIVSRIHDMIGNHVLLAVPLFVLMGCLLERAGLAERLFHVMYVWSGRMRGGLAIGVILTGTILAALVGVVGAEVVTLGLVALPSLIRRGYDRNLSLGVICAAGSLGAMIPPSIVLIFYGLIANVSITGLFMAAALPGIMLAGSYIAYIVLVGLVAPDKVPAAPAEDRPKTLIETILLGRQLVFPLGIIACVLGALYAGIATPTEAAAIGTFLVVLVMIFERTFSKRVLAESVVQTSKTVGSVVWIFLGANALISVYAFAGGLTFITNTMISLDLPAIGLILVMFAIFFVLGMIVDWIAIAFLTLPVFVPIVSELGFDLVWFGIIFCLSMQISYLTPPFGPAAFYLRSVAPKDVTLEQIYAGIFPFVLLQVIVIGLCLFFPGLVLWLPKTLGTG